MTELPSEGGTEDGGPVLVGANWYRFRPAEHIRHERVASVSFVWVVQGVGVIRSRGEEFWMGPPAIVRLPWQHDVDYTADGKSPFHVGTIHVIPWHARSVPVTARVAHRPDDPLLDAPFRRGTRDRPALLGGRSTVGRNVVALASYAVEKFVSSSPEETTLRALGELIMSESLQWNDTSSIEQRSPVMLEVMTDFVVANLDRPLKVHEIAAAADCSVATAERLFARHTGRSVLAWVRSARMEHAAALLRTSSLRVGEVARLVGYADPLYFSRVFKHAFSVPPSTYAIQRLRP